MAKVTAPLLSLGASGTIGKTQTYARWRGVPYARQRVTPANPRSASQTQTRTSFSWLAGLWKLLGADAQAPWTAFAKGKPLTARNALMSFNISPLRTASDITGFTASPGANGGMPLAAFSATGGSGSITTTVTTPELPSGWTLTKVVALAIPAQNPQEDTSWDSATEAATTSPWEPSFSDLAAGPYQVFAWPVITKDDGSLAYGPSLTHAATVT